MKTKSVNKRVTTAAALLAAAATFGSITVGDLAVANAAMDVDKFDTCMKGANYKTLDEYYTALKKCCEDSGGVYSSYFKSCSPPDDGFKKAAALPTRDLATLPEPTESSPVDRLRPQISDTEVTFNPVP